MKVLFSDMDGTVINHEGILHEKDRKMMHELQNHGHKVVFNTGRNYQEALFVLHKHNFPYDYLVLNNGAHIVDKEGKEIFKKLIPENVGKGIIEYCMEQPDLWTFFYTEERTIGYLNGKTYEHSMKGIHETTEYNFIEEYQKMGSFNIIALNQDNHQIDILLRVQKFIAETYGEYAAGCLNTEYLDITAAGCSKGTGVRTLEETMQEDIESYCIGDSFKDLSMFEIASYAYTFHHVSEEISKHTDKQVDCVYELISDMLK
ncbi:MAG: HAD-IIB family hydrolase [Coprobacillaceae bacterium]